MHSVTADATRPNFQEMSGPELARAKAADARLQQGRSARAFSLLAPAHEIELPYVDAPVRIHRRPLLEDFLVEAAKLGELVVFSAGADGYVRAVAELIDPSGGLFGGRVLTRKHCRPVDAVMVKDLSQLGRPLERVVLIDDNVASCMLQPDNAVPIRPFFGDPDDRELSSLVPLLRTLRDQADVRSTLRDTYRLQEKLLGGVRDMKAAAASMQW